MPGRCKDAGLNRDEVGYINAHGTGTAANDKTECAAVADVFGHHADKLMISSTKSMHGHLIGGTGAVELLACIMALRDGIIAPTIGYEEPDPECALDVVPNVAREAKVERGPVERLRLWRAERGAGAAPGLKKTPPRRTAFLSRCAAVTRRSAAATAVISGGEARSARSPARPSGPGPQPARCVRTALDPPLKAAISSAVKPTRAKQPPREHQREGIAFRLPTIDGQRRPVGSAGFPAARRWSHRRRPAGLRAGRTC